MAAFDPPPNPDASKGMRAGRYIRLLWAWLVRNRVVTEPGGGIEAHPTSGGMLLRLTASALGISIIRTTSTITARSGTTPGTGSGVRVNWNGTALSDGPVVTLRNITAGALGSGKYGFAVRVGVSWFVLSLEC